MILPRLAALGLTLAVTLVSCQRGGNGDVSVEVQNTLDGLQSSGPPPGVRTYESFFGERPVALREAVRVGEDGVRALDLIGADHRSPEDFAREGLSRSWEQLRALHAQRASFALKYRDFRIRDAALALRHYAFVEDGRGSVAHRATRRWIVRPLTPDRPTYRIDLDEETGALLGYEERDSSGRLLERLTYESLAASEPVGDAPAASPALDTPPAPDPHAAPAATPPATPPASREVVSIAQARDALDLPLPEALEIPGGFSLVSHEIMRLGTLPGAPAFFSSLFTDGVQPIILLAQPLPAGPGSSDAGAAPGGETPADRGAASVAAVREEGEPLVAEVSVSRDGPLTLLQVDVLGMRVMLLGRVDREVLAAFLDALDFARS